MDKSRFAEQIGAIMDAAGPDETHDGLSININAPCTNRIAGRDYIEVNIHLGGRPENSHGSQGTNQSLSEEDESVVRDADTDAVEVLVPRALRIARQFRSADCSM